MSEDLKAELAALRPRLMRFAAMLTRSVDAADDLTQTALAKALARLAQFEPGSRLDRWLFRIAHTAWIDQARAAKRRPAAGPAAFEFLDDEGAAARGVEARLELAELRRAIAQLPEEQRAALALVAFEGLTYREAGEALGVPPGTVMSRLARARRRLVESRAGGSAR